jgi:predicted PurR-regulated permease PerM
MPLACFAACSTSFRFWARQFRLCWRCWWRRLIVGGRVLGVAIFFVLYLQVENSWLVPRIMKNRVNLPALGIFVALLLGSALEGIPGAMVAIPTAVLVSVLLEEYLVHKGEV